jgi:hypothetical protein
LRNFLGCVGIAGFTQGGGINQVHMARNQDFKSGFGIPAGVLPQQIHVRRVVHPLINGRHRPKVPINFQPRMDTDKHGFFQRKDAKAPRRKVLT